jgi:hypothetical protein
MSPSAAPRPPFGWSDWLDHRIGLVWGIVVGLAVLIVGVALDLEIYEAFHDWTRAHEDWEIDEILPSILPIFVGLAVDFGRAASRYNKNAAQLKVYLQLAEQMKEQEAKHIENMLAIRKQLYRSGTHDATISDLLDRMILRSHKNLQRLHKRSDISPEVMPLVVGDYTPDIEPRDLESPPPDYDQFANGNSDSVRM